MTLNGKEVSPRMARITACVSILAGCAAAAPWLFGLLRGSVAFGSEVARVPATNALVQRHEQHLQQNDQRLSRLETDCTRREARNEQQFRLILAELRRVHR